MDAPGDANIDVPEQPMDRGASHLKHQHLPERIQAESDHHHARKLT